jgi:hypothetical protein
MIVSSNKPFLFDTKTGMGGIIGYNIYGGGILEWLSKRSAAANAIKRGAFG